MPVKQSAAKALRQSKKRGYLNKRAKDNLKDLAKKTRKAIESGSNETQELVKKTLKATDKLVGRGILKKNTAARKKSRLMKKFNEKLANAKPQNEQKREE
ncbi:MAG: 30S ribosomal protein S20 [Patescibacteria group bacterium]|nr:30S ribosomal protein S20 [Patescibacteria group bacterium]